MERIVEVGSARLPVTDAGDGPPVMFLHAGVADRRSWVGLRSALSDSPLEYRFLAYDRRGFGEATWGPESHSPLSDLVAVLETFNSTPATLVGNSQGGRLAIDLALARPDLVAALVLVGTAVSGAPPPNAGQQAAISTLSDAIDEADQAGDLERVNELECQLWLDGPAAPSRRVGGAVRSLFLEMNRVALHASDVGEATWATDSWSRLEELDLPTCVVVGDLDLPHIVERSAIVARRVQGASIVTLAETAHLVALEDPLRFSAVLQSFLASVGGARP